MAYYTSETCGYTFTDCTTDYAQSEVKYVVDAWKNDQTPASIEARLITLEELFELGYRHPNESDFDRFGIDTSTISEEEADGSLGADYVDIYNGRGVVRPVITLPKSVLKNS